MALPTTSGLTWRAPTPDDADALVALTKRIHEAERLEFVPGPSFYRWLMGQAEFDPATDWTVAVDAEGRIVADGGAWIQVTDQGGRAFVWAETGPGHHELEPSLLQWATARAIEGLGATAAGLPRSIRVPTEEHRARHRAVIEASGLEVGRSFVTMTRPLEDLPESPPLPTGVSVVPWAAEWAEGARVANNNSFADHWGSLPVSAEQWRTAYAESEQFRPDLSFLALADGEVVAICLCEVDPESNAEKGVEEVYVERVGTVRTHRRQRIASHLLTRSMAGARESGLSAAALEVDETSHTSATEVYRRLGFEVASRNVHYLREI
ncbi:MAG: GNAT family N-acetyltransferase [Acidimicrobiia bacterium]